MTDTLISGPRSWFSRAHDVISEDVIARFGARDPHNVPKTQATVAAMEAARMADVKAKAHADAIQYALIGDPELHSDFAAGLDMLARLAEYKRVDARAIGWFNHAATLYSLQGILETMAAEVRAATQEIKP